MDNIFPRALVECVKSGAPPTREQLSTVAMHIWRDWCRSLGFACLGMPHDPMQASLIHDLAWLALTGEICGAPESWVIAEKRFPVEDRVLEMAC